MEGEGISSLGDDTMFKDIMVASGQLFDGSGQPSCLFVIRRICTGRYKVWITSTLCARSILDEGEVDTIEQAMCWVVDRADY